MPYNTAPIPPRKEATGTTQLPLSRVKKMIQVDSDIHACSISAAFVLTVATEMFVQYLAEQAHNVAKSEKKPRRNIQYRDISSAVSNHDNLEFLVDVVPKTVPYKEAKKLTAGPKTNGESSVEAGQTTLDGMKPTANGTNGFGGHAGSSAVLDDEEGADPNEQLKMESRGARLSSGSTISNAVSNGKEPSQDVEMK